MQLTVNEARTFRVEGMQIVGRRKRIESSNPMRGLNGNTGY